MFSTLNKKLSCIVVGTMLAASLLSGCGTIGGYATDATTEKADEIFTTNDDTVGNSNDLAGTSGDVTSPTDSTAKALDKCKYVGMSADEIVDSLTLEMKAAQMVQPAVYNVDKKRMRENCYGSILSSYEALEYDKWQELIDGFQKEALLSEAGVPYLYGQDNVHGANYAFDTVIFPHNIGLGAANDPELMYKVGQITADESKLCHTLWVFSPVLAQSVDPRWGRTYESYGADLELIKSLGTAYTKGLIDGGVVACAKHFFADGNAVYGTGEKSDFARLIDRGDAKLTEDEIAKLLDVYQAEIDAGVQTIMISHSSLNGVKMHENAKYIQYLKNEMGFEGFIVSDWESIQNTSGETYEDQVITAINSGIDMLMEVASYNEAMKIIVDAVNSGRISEERVNDAVKRIIQVKIDEGIIDDPFCEKMETVKSEPGSKEYREVAEKLVEESLVLLKNEGDVLPFKEGTKVYITGPAADNVFDQCGGWTIEWDGCPIVDDDLGFTSILQGFLNKASENNITVITDEKKADEADVVLLVVGEQSYAEWYGDTDDLDLCGALGMSGNSTAINKVKELGKPVVTCIVAGRHVLIDNYEKDWDGIVMCYLPGSEGQGVADVLCGKENFRGKLPSPWYRSIEQIGTDECWHEMGYGLTY